MCVGHMHTRMRALRVLRCIRACVLVWTVASIMANMCERKHAHTIARNFVVRMCCVSQLLTDTTVPPDCNNLQSTCTTPHLLSTAGGNNTCLYAH